MAGKPEDEPRTKGKSGGKKGLAPFASLEDLSDDSPPDDKNRLTLPGIKEDPTPTGRTNITPRIDISRASSSSHHEDSSPERELFSGGGEGGAKIGLGFSEEMAAELRNSTEELDFQDPEEETKSRRKKLQQQPAVGFIHVTKYELDAQGEDTRERKDSGCSDSGLLLIGDGRTSRLSSIGSVASGGSVASHCSAQSHLSAVSNYSRASRCSSPHRTLVETSFCGPKPIPTLSLEAEYPPKESVEATLLARKTDITGAVLPNDENIKMSLSSGAKAFTGKTSLDVRSRSSLEPHKSNKAARSLSERAVKSGASSSVAVRSSSARAPRKKVDENALVRIIPLHGSLDDDSEPEPEPVTGDSNYTPEYGIYIPLKGPIIDPTIRPDLSKPVDTKSATKSRKPEIEESDLVQFISLHGEDDERIQREKTEGSRINFRNGQSVVQFRPRKEEPMKSLLKKPKTPEPKSKTKPSTLDVANNGRPAQSMTHLPRDESRTPSPASSFARGGLFRRSSDSSSSSRKSNMGSDKSKKDSKNKSMFTSLFKKNTKEPTTPKAHEKPTLDPKMMNVEFRFKPEEPDTIIIPLHSPDSVIKPCIEDITPDITQEVEIKSPKHHQRELQREDTSPVKPVVEKNIIVVDVINSDTALCFEAVLEAPARHSKEIQTLELENLESEPKVRRSSHSSAHDIEMKSEDPVEPEIEPESSPPVEIEPTSKSEANPEIDSSAVSQRSTEDKASSESEMDLTGTAEEAKVEEYDEERKGLFHQAESVDDELPYVPTTLPQERSVAMPIVPIRQRISEVKTCPVDRPRSTTPIQPSNLDEYAAAHDSTSIRAPTSEKMQIILPRTDSIGRSRSPGRPKPWAQFAEEALGSPKEGRKRGEPESPPGAPPLPPRGAQWVMFDEQQPERRRAPRRITTLPTHQPPPTPPLFSYVNPEECSCECHEAAAQCTTRTDRCTYRKSPSRTDKEKRFRT